MSTDFRRSTATPHPFWLRAILGAPTLWTMFFALSTIAALTTAVLRLEVEADVAKVIRGNTDAYAQYERLEAEFRHPSRDEILVVRAEGLGDPQTFFALQDFVIELQLIQSVEAVLSVFNVPDPDGLTQTLLARKDIQSLPPVEQLQRFYESGPPANFLISGDFQTTILSVLPNLDVSADTRLTALNEVIAGADPRLAVSIQGIAAFNREIGASLISDQTLLIPVGVLACLLCVLLLFRSWHAAVICGVAPVLSLIWIFGILAATGTAFSPFMAAVPVVLIVLSVSCSVHVYHTVLRMLPSHSLEDALALSLKELLPAVVLTTGTTALAFLSLLWLGSPVLATMGVIGAVGLLQVFVAVYVAMPIAMLAFGRDSAVRTIQPRFEPMANLFVSLLKVSGPLRLTALTGLIVLGLAQLWSERGFDLKEHIPHASSILEDIANLESQMAGSGFFYVLVDGSGHEPDASILDRARLREVAAAIYGPENSLAFSDVGFSITGALRQRFMGQQQLDFTLPVPTNLASDWQSTLTNAAVLETRLDEANLASVTTVSGYTLMVNTEMPQMVAEMRRAFYLAVLGVALLIWLVYRSASLAALSLVPNLMPILFVEAMLALSGTPLTLTAAISLTIAFGIAVDDSIHLINRTHLIRAKTGLPIRDCVSQALPQVVPPVLVTSAVLTVGLMVSAFSSLPSIAIFGTLAASATVAAVVADLVFFPSLLLWLPRRLT
jgi:predicted RND superfamily exporter protein